MFPSNTIFKIQATVMNYPWGSKSRIGQLFGKKQTEKIAELWYGSHERGPSIIADPNINEENLQQLLRSNAAHLLGQEQFKRYGATLPFLLKIITAEIPLSIQVHPNKQQAESGFKKENALGVDIHAAERNYRDTNHKPECLIALGDFSALSGFRSPEAILRNLPRNNHSLLKKLRSILESSTSNALGGGNSLHSFFTHLMTADSSDKHSLLELILESIPKQGSSTYWVQELHKQFPQDIGCLAPLYLNLLELKKGDALFMQGGVLHAYLRGTGLEIMANSDNVLRAGCTQKHIDIPELLSILQFTNADPTRPQKNQYGWYTSYVPEFQIAIVECDKGTHLPDLRTENYIKEKAAIILVLKGNIEIQGEQIRCSESAFISAGENPLIMNSSPQATVAIACARN